MTYFLVHALTTEGAVLNGRTNEKETRMPNLDEELRRRLIKKFGDKIDLKAHPQILRELVAEIARRPAVFIAGSDSHYKGDEHTKEIPPSGLPYTRQYLRGVAMSKIEDLVSNVHDRLDDVLLDVLRAGLKEVMSPGATKK